GKSPSSIVSDESSVRVSPAFTILSEEIFSLSLMSSQYSICAVGKQEPRVNRVQPLSSKFLVLSVRFTTELPERNVINELHRYLHTHTDQKKTFRFRHGLCPDLCYTLTVHVVLPYSEIVRRATELEVFINAQRAAVPSLRPTPAIQPANVVKPTSSLGKRKADLCQDQKKKKHGAPDRRDIPPAVHLRCANCGRTHAGQCWFPHKVCFNCQRSGHFLSVCPSPRRQSYQKQPPQQQQQQLPPPPQQ
ncbi:Unknown protein, partial [Striga hermonthica]